MTWNHVHRETAPHVGDPEDESLTEVTGIAPPCDRCGRREAAERVDGQDLCEDCADDVKQTPDQFVLDDEDRERIAEQVRED